MTDRIGPAIHTMPMKQIFLEKNKPVEDVAVDRLEKLLRSKFELKTGFAEPGQLSRTLYRALLALDTAGTEDFDINRFATAMKKLNCGEDRAAVEALFHRYDTTDSGIVTMKDFADSVFGIRVIPRSSPECRDVIALVRDRLLARGENAYRGLVRTLRMMDTNGSDTLEPQELSEGLSKYGLRLSGQELSVVFKYFDTDRSGTISITEFIAGLRPTISPARLALVKLAFLRLDKNPDGKVTLDELRSMYRTDRHPSVLDGTKSPDDVLRDFEACWDKNGDGIVTEAEFTEYYKDLSAAIDNDAYFELMIRNAWHITGGSGQAENTANLRVLVTHLDGTQSVETIINDLGLPDKKQATLIAALKKQGATDVLKAEIATAL